jgi:S-adenosylmethionine uptake transporter
MSSVWVGAFLVGSQWLLGRSRAPQQAPLMLAVLAGFVGVVMVLRPTLEQQQLLAGLIGLVSGLLSALAYLQVSTLGRMGEPDERTVLFFGLACALFGAMASAALDFSSLNTVAAQGATLVVANLQYSGIVFGAFYSLLLFGDQIPLIGWLGMVLITASGVLATILREPKSAPTCDP